MHQSLIFCLSSSLSPLLHVLAALTEVKGPLFEKLALAVRYVTHHLTASVFVLL
jgi:hypothetical protein